MPGKGTLALPRPWAHLVGMAGMVISVLRDGLMAASVAVSLSRSSLLLWVGGVLGTWRSIHIASGHRSVPRHDIVWYRRGADGG